jgi:hypothetical protein
MDGEDWQRTEGGFTLFESLCFSPAKSGSGNPEETFDQRVILL